MLFTQLFEDDFNKKKLNESLADEFMAMAKAKGYNPRLRGTPDEERARTDAMLKQRAADRTAAPAPEHIGDEERARLQAKLKELEAKFDPNYQYIDAPSGGEWAKQDAIAKQIGAIKQKLSQGMAEAAKWRDPKYKDRLYTQEPGDSDEYDDIGYGYDFPERPDNDPGQKRRMGGVGSEFDHNDPLKKGQGIGRTGIKHNLNTAGKRKGLPSRDQITSLKGSIKDAHGKHHKPNLPEQGVAESRMAELDAEYQDYKKLSPREFFNTYKITKQAWFEKHKSMLPQQSMDEDVRLPYPVRSEKLGRANMELLVRAYNEPTGPRTTLSFGDRILELDRDDVEAIAHYYDNILKDDNARWNFVKGIMSDPDGLTDVLIKLGRRKPGAARQPGLFQEADKKKDDDLGAEVKDVALQRAISRAKADFPTAGSGIEALAKDFMRSQDQDQKSFDQLRQAERKQDSLLNQINKIDQEQAQEIDDLENQNSGLARRLQQLQNVNSELEKKLAAMSGRRAEKTSSAEPMPTSSKSEPAVVAPKSKPAKGKKVKDKKTKSLPPPKSQPALAAPTAPSAMSSVAQQLTTQNPNVLEPDVTDKTPDELPRFRRFDTTQATDVPYRTPTPNEMPGDVAQNVDAYADAMVGDKLRQTVDQELAKTENKQNKSEPPEADYGPKYQDMVSRVGQLAKQGPRKTVWDPVKRVYKTVPVKPVKEQEPGNRAGYNAIKSVSDWADKLRTMQELQKDIKLMADPEAKAAVQQRMGELLKLGIERGYTK